MKHLLPLFFFLLGLQVTAQKKFDYPSTPKDDTVDMYFEDSIQDPYQWMENPEDPRLEVWLKEQKKIENAQTKKQTHIWDLRAQLGSMYRNTRREETKDYVDRDDKGEDKYEFESKWNSFHNTLDLLYKRVDQKNYRRLFRGKELIENAGNVLVRSISVNEDEDLVAVSVSVNGSDWATAYVFNLITGKQLEYKIDYIRTFTNLKWHGRDLYYNYFDKPASGRELLDKATGEKLAKINVDDAEFNPTILYKNPDTTGVNSFRYSIVDDNLHLYHYLKSKDTWYRAISIADLNQDRFVPRRFLIYPNDKNSELSIELVKNDSIFLKTNMGAPNGKLLLANLNRPNQLSEFVPEYDINLRYVNKLGKDKIACVYLEDGQNIALIFNLQGELLRKIDFPKGKKLENFYELSDEAEFTNFSINSFFHPRLRYELSLKDLSFKPIESVSVPYSIENLETRYIEFESKDGTKVPMYITCYTDVELDGSHPVLMHGYGGYGHIVEPRFDQHKALFLAHGGILATPNVRGGGAKGDEWAQEGRGLKKQNTIDDFIGAAEYLIEKGYTNPEKLSITGGSHGGMLVAASITQRPELFKAAIAEAGVYDMLRFNKFTIGSVNININEFGTPDNLEDYNNLRSYSPLHKLKEGIKYPNLLLITGDTDDRVPPLHTYKFLAQLQEYGDPSSLYHMYVTPGSGHAGALSPEDFIEYELFKYYFLFDQLDIKFYKANF